MTHAHQQRLSRLRYEAGLAQRQFMQVDPENRLVAAELEKRWEAALAELKRAQEATASSTPSPLLALPEELQAAIRAIGQHLPGLWRQGLLKPVHQKALLRCLIDLVVVRRPTLECVEVRIVWRGGATTDMQVPVPVGALADLAGAKAMERIILERSAQGAPDEVIAAELTAQSYRSPMRLVVLPSTVKIIRLKHGIFRVRSQSHPRHVGERSRFHRSPKFLTLRRIGFTIVFTKAVFRSAGILRPTCTCSLMTLPPLSSFDNCGQGPSRPCVFQRSILMHDRNSL